MKFTNQVAIVAATETTGIGQATYQTLAQGGSSVMGSDIQPRQMAAFSGEIASTCNVSTLVVGCDIADQ